MYIHTAGCSVGVGGALEVSGGRVGRPLLAHGIEAVDWTALPGLEVGRQLVLLTPHERGQGLHKGNSL